MQARTFEMQLGGRTLTVETGKYAEQAGGSCLVRCGDTAVLVCATVAKTARDGVDFLPLSVEFEEKLYSVGKIPGATPLPSYVEWTAKTVRWILPDLEIFNIRSVVVHGLPLPDMYLFWSTLHGIGWTVFLMALSSVWFSRRDFV